jgi:hypothetical protein
MMFSRLAPSRLGAITAVLVIAPTLHAQLAVTSTSPTLNAGAAPGIA